MNIFKDFTFKWCQAGIFKLALYSPGIAIGSTRPELFRGWTPFLFLFFLISGGLCHLRVVEAVKSKHCHGVCSLSIFGTEAGEPNRAVLILK